MPKSISSLDLLGAQLKGARFENLATYPANSGVGRVFENTADGFVYYWSGTKWIKAASGGGAGSYYRIPSEETIAIAENGLLHLPVSLSLEGQIVLDGMISDSVWDG